MEAGRMAGGRGRRSAMEGPSKKGWMKSWVFLLAAFAALPVVMIVTTVAIASVADTVLHYRGDPLIAPYLGIIIAAVSFVALVSFSLVLAVRELTRGKEQPGGSWKSSLVVLGVSLLLLPAGIWFVWKLLSRVG
jgi:hypothetical protein